MYVLVFRGTQFASQLLRIDKRFYNPAAIDRWIVVVYERQQRFNQQSAQDMIAGLVQGCTEVGTWIGRNVSWPSLLSFSLRYESR